MEFELFDWLDFTAPFVNKEAEDDISEYVGDGEGDGCCWDEEEMLILMLSLFLLRELSEPLDSLLLRNDGVGIVKGIPKFGLFLFCS